MATTDSAKFELENGATVDVWIDEDGNLKVCASSTATKLFIMPQSNGSFDVKAVRNLGGKS